MAEFLYTSYILPNKALMVQLTTAAESIDSMLQEKSDEELRSIAVKVLQSLNVEDAEEGVYKITGGREGLLDMLVGYAVMTGENLPLDR